MAGARGKALVAELRARPDVRDAEALAAWIGRYKRLRMAGASPKKARTLAGKPGGLKEGGTTGVKPGSGISPGAAKGPKVEGGAKDRPTVDLAGGGTATYNPQTKTAIIPNDAIGFMNKGGIKRGRENVRRIEEAFPDVERIGSREDNTMTVERLKRALGIKETPTPTPTPDPKPSPKPTPDREEMDLPGGGKAKYYPAQGTVVVPKGATKRSNVDAIRERWPEAKTIKEGKDRRDMATINKMFPPKGTTQGDDAIGKYGISKRDEASARAALHGQGYDIGNGERRKRAEETQKGYDDKKTGDTKARQDAYRRAQRLIAVDDKKIKPGALVASYEDRPAEVQRITPDGYLETDEGRINPVFTRNVSDDPVAKRMHAAKKRPDGGSRAPAPTDPNTKNVPNVGEVKYDPTTRLVRVPNDALEGTTEEKRRDIDAIEKAFPRAEHITYGKSESYMRIDHWRNMNDIPRPRPKYGIAPGEGSERTKSEGSRGINPTKRGAFYNRNEEVVVIRRAPAGPPTEKDKAQVLQKYPGAERLIWHDGEYRLKKEAPKEGHRGPVDDYITIPAGGGKRLDSARRGNKAISDVHDVENLTPIPVVTKREKRGTMGMFRYSMRGRPVSINVASAEHPHTTYAHEVGHYLDLDGLGPKGRYDSQQVEGETAKLLRTIDRSETATRLQDMLDNPDKYTQERTVQMGSGREYTYSTSPSREHLSYLNSPEEKFARAYAQYISRKSEDPKMSSEMQEQITTAHLTEASYPSQWKHNEFGPIEKAFDELFDSKGWLKGSATNKLSSDDRAEIVNLLSEGIPVRELAARFGVSESYIRKLGGG